MLEKQEDLDIRNRMERLQKENPFLPINQIVCTLVREDILLCRLEPGAKLSEEQCAQRYAASRTTVRKAFDTLLEEGWLKKDEGHGVKVSTMRREDYLDLMEYRAIIEPAACRLAARNRLRGDLQQIERFTQMCDTPDMEELYFSDTGFHRAIFAAGKNPYLMKAYELVSRKMERGKIYTVEDFSEVYKDVYREHRAIFEAVRDGDEELARRLGYQHIKMMLDSRIIRKPMETE